MHNGTMATLDDVIDFYDKGGGAGSELKALNLSASEKKALKAFLMSMSGDQVMVKDPGQPDMQVWKTYGKN
jgi:cytochrome c peroxidase